MNSNSGSDNFNLDSVPITVLGLGHIGLPTALGLAELGRHVIGADDDLAKVQRIRSGDPNFYEPGLSELLAKHLKSGRFQPQENVAAAVRDGSIIFICVGTPQKTNGQADLAQMEAVAQVVARNLNGYKLLVEKSTIPTITARAVGISRAGSSAAEQLDGSPGDCGWKKRV